MTEQENEIFIDADSGFGNEKNSYEVIILNQITACVRVLSREMTGGQIMYKESSSGTEKYIEDVRELVINHVDTLKMLMTTYVKGKNKQQLNMILNEIEEYKDELLDTNKVVPGKGIVKLRNIKGINPTDPIWKEFIHHKALRYREVFEILVCSYNEEKAYIRSLEEE